MSTFLCPVPNLVAAAPAVEAVVRHGCFSGILARMRYNEAKYSSLMINSAKSDIPTIAYCLSVCMDILSDVIVNCSELI